MVEAKEDVNKMKAELAIKNQELAAASKEAEALLKSISESTAVAEKGAYCSCPCWQLLHATHLVGWSSTVNPYGAPAGLHTLFICDALLLLLFQLAAYLVAIMSVICLCCVTIFGSFLPVACCTCREAKGGCDCGSGIQESSRNRCREGRC